MCNLSLPGFVYPFKSLPIRVDAFPVWDQGPILGGEGTTKLCFLSVLSSAAGPLHRAFPTQLIKSLTGWCKASSVFKNPYRLRFCSLFSSLVRRSAKNPCWGQKQVGSTTTYLATIFQIPSIITLNVNGLKAPIKRHRVPEWIREQDIYIYILSLRDPPQNKISKWTKSKRMEKRYFVQIERKNLG